MVQIQMIQIIVEKHFYNDFGMFNLQKKKNGKVFYIDSGLINRFKFTSSFV